MKCLGLATVLVCLTVGVEAADDAGDFSVRGAGLLDCEAFVSAKEQESRAYVMVGGWLDGYVTAVNQYRQDTYDITAFQSTELLSKILEAHCRRNPDDRLFAVVNSMVHKLHEQRIADKADYVVVEVGSMRTRLYREVVERVQRRLAAADLLTGQQRGEFDRPTLEALAAYQESVGFEPTGFPDQATLWTLLAEESISQ